MFLSGKKLFDWQQECLKNWVKNDCRGIANVVTGGGKTLLALGAVVRAREAGLAELRIKIVVPKIFLMHQWADALCGELGVPPDEIGYFYGGRRDGGEREKPYMLYVINSARYTLARHITADMKAGCAVFLIADECHHYSSAENLRIFDFLPALPLYPGRFLSLGLSATPVQPGAENILEPLLGKEIYRFGLASALESDVISQFQIFSLGVDFSNEELDAYEEYTGALRITLQKLKSQVPVLRKASGGRFFALLQKLAREPHSRTAPLAKSALILAFQRRTIVYQAQARTFCVEDLIARLDPNARILIFGERIEMADVLYRKLAGTYTGQVGRYHSGMSPQMKKDTLGLYQTGQIRILVSCRALDEGLNIPETDVGIILSESENIRQRIQRLGRILRKTPDRRAACLYCLYVRQAAGSEVDLGEFQDFPALSLTYHRSERTFQFPEYDFLCEQVLHTLFQRGTRRQLIAECEKNMWLGAVRGDFLLSEALCNKRLENARDRAERNYWIAQACLIRARLGKA